MTGNGESCYTDYADCTDYTDYSRHAGATAALEPARSAAQAMRDRRIHAVRKALNCLDPSVSQDCNAGLWQLRPALECGLSGKHPCDPCDPFNPCSKTGPARGITTGGEGHINGASHPDRRSLPGITDSARLCRRSSLRPDDALVPGFGPRRPRVHPRIDDARVSRRRRRDRRRAQSRRCGRSPARRSASRSSTAN